ncbi:MAG: glycosyltransferase family 2 protein [Bacteroidales bacterium]|nr:glycosyltransferase family 2 protein [Candidatus Physcocola equi]
MISVIVHLHNQENTIISALQSLVAQTAQQWECFIVDNASTDASEYQVRSYLIDRRMRYLRLEQQVSTEEVWNIGLQHTTGEWVVFFDGADYMKSNALQALYLAVKTYGTQCGAGNYGVIRNGELNTHSYDPSRKVSQKDVAKGKLSVLTGASIFSRKIADKPEFWKDCDFAYTDHLILISGEESEPLIKRKKQPWWKQLFNL